MTLAFIIIALIHKEIRTMTRYIPLFALLFVGCATAENTLNYTEKVKSQFAILEAEDRLVFSPIESLKFDSDQGQVTINRSCDTGTCAYNYNLGKALIMKNHFQVLLSEEVLDKIEQDQEINHQEEMLLYFERTGFGYEGQIHTVPQSVMLQVINTYQNQESLLDIDYDFEASGLVGGFFNIVYLGNATYSSSLENLQNRNAQVTISSVSFKTKQGEELSEVISAYLQLQATDDNITFTVDRFENSGGVEVTGIDRLESVTLKSSPKIDPLYLGFDIKMLGDTTTQTLEINSVNNTDQTTGSYTFRCYGEKICPLH